MSFNIYDTSTSNLSFRSVNITSQGTSISNENVFGQTGFALEAAKCGKADCARVVDDIFLETDYTLVLTKDQMADPTDPTVTVETRHLSIRPASISATELAPPGLLSGEDHTGKMLLWTEDPSSEDPDNPDFAWLYVPFSSAVAGVTSITAGPGLVATSVTSSNTAGVVGDVTVEIQSGGLDADQIGDGEITLSKLAEPSDTGTSGQSFVWNGTEWITGQIQSQQISTQTPSVINIQEEQTGNSNTTVVDIDLVEGSINHEFLADNAVENENVLDGTLEPSKFKAPSGMSTIPSLFVYAASMWSSKRFDWSWNAEGGILSQTEVSDEGTPLTNPLILAAINGMKRFTNGLNNTNALHVSGLNADATTTYDPNIERTSIYVDSGTSTFTSHTLPATMTVENSLTDDSEDGNLAAALDMRTSPLKFSNMKYFYPVVAQATTKDTGPYMGKSLVVTQVKFDKDTTTNRYIPNLYFSLQ